MATKPSSSKGGPPKTKKKGSKFKFWKSTSDISDWSKNDDKLFQSVQRSEVEKAEQLLAKKGCPPTKMGPHGSTAFHQAATQGNLEMVNLILAHQGDVEAIDSSGRLPIHCAARHGWANVVDRLLQVKNLSHVVDNDKLTPLHHACLGGDLHCCSLLLENSSPPNAIEKRGHTPLFIAAQMGHPDICRELVENGAVPDARDANKRTSLMLAAQYGNKGVCEYLIRKGANTKLMDIQGHDACWYAVNNGHPELKPIFENAPTRLSWNLAREDDHEEQARWSMMANPDVSTYNGTSKPDYVGSAVSSLDQLEHGVVPFDDKQDSDSDQEGSKEDIGYSTISEVAAPANTRVSPARSNKDRHSEIDVEAYKELEEEHEYINEELRRVNVDNRRLQEQVEKLMQRRESGKSTSPKSHSPHDYVNTVSLDLEEELKEVKSKLAVETSRSSELQEEVSELRKQLEDDEKADASRGRKDTWSDSDEEGELFESPGASKKKSLQAVAVLKSQVHTLTKENEQLMQQIQKSGGATDSRHVVDVEEENARLTEILQNYESIENEYHEIRSRSATIESVNKDQQEQLAKLTEVNAHLNQRLNHSLEKDGVATEMRFWMSKIEELEQELEDLRRVKQHEAVGEANEVHLLRAQIKAMQLENERLRDGAIIELEKSSDDLAGSLGEEPQELYLLKNQIYDLRAKALNNEQLQEEIKKQQEIMVQLSDQNKRLSTQLKEVPQVQAGSIEDHSYSVIPELEHRITELESENQRIEDERLGSFKRMEGKLADLHNENSTLRKKMRQQEKVVATGGNVENSSTLHSSRSADKHSSGDAQLVVEQSKHNPLKELMEKVKEMEFQKNKNEDEKLETFARLESKLAELYQQNQLLIEQLHASKHQRDEAQNKVNQLELLNLTLNEKLAEISSGRSSAGIDVAVAAAKAKVEEERKDAFVRMEKRMAELYEQNKFLNRKLEEIEGLKDLEHQKNYQLEILNMKLNEKLAMLATKYGIEHDNSDLHKFTDAEVEVVKLREQIRDLQQEKESSQQAAGTAEVVGLQERITELEQEKDQLEEERKGALTHLEERMSKFYQHNMALGEQLEEVEQLREDEKERMAALEALNKALFEQLSPDQQSEVADMIEGKSSAEENRHMIARIAELENERQMNEEGDRQKAFRAMESRIAELYQENESLHQKLHGIEDEQEEIKRRGLNKQDREKQTLLDKINKLEKEKAILLKQTEQHDEDDKYQTLLDKIQQIKKEKTVLEDERIDAFKLMERRLSELHAENESLVKEKADNRNKASEQEKFYQLQLNVELNKKLSEIGATRREEHKRLVELETQNALLRKDMESAEKSLDAAENARKKASDHEKDLTAEIKQLSHQLNLLQSVIDNPREGEPDVIQVAHSHTLFTSKEDTTRIKALQTEIENLKAENASLIGQINTLRKQHRDALHNSEMDIDRLNLEVRSLKRTISEHQDKLDLANQAQAELKQLQEERNKLLSNVETFKLQLHEAEKRAESAGRRRSGEIDPRIQALISENDDLKEALQKLQVQLQMAHQRGSSRDGGSQRSQNSVNSTVVGHRQSDVAGQPAMRSLITENDELKKEIGDLKNRDMMIVVTGKQSDEKLRHDYVALSVECEKMKNEMKRLHRYLEVRQNNNNIDGGSLENNEKFLYSENENLREQSARLEEENTSLRCKLLEYRGNNSDVKTDLQIKKQWESLEGLSSAADVHLEAEKKRVDVLRKENEDLRNELKRVYTEMGRLEVKSSQQLNKLISERDQLAERLNNAEMRLLYQLQQISPQFHDCRTLEHIVEKLEREGKMLLLPPQRDAPDGGDSISSRNMSAADVDAASQTIAHLQGELTKVMQENSAQRTELSDLRLRVQRPLSSHNKDRQLQMTQRQVTRLQQQLEKCEQRHQEIVSTYRTHLLSAVQGHMDPEVQQALQHIVKLRSSEQYC